MLRHLIPLSILAAFFAGVLAYMLLERARHQRNLNKIRHKVLVNGSRGKSSVTRLVRAAIAANPDQTVIGKTTGSAARFIYPGGREVPIIRKNAIVNVIEQIAVIARAASLKATCAVVECMAVDPDLQQLNQEVLIQSGIGVITNVRPDHLDEMGGPDRTVEQVARSLCRGMPVGGVCVTAEKDLWPILAGEAARRGTTLLYADPGTVTDAEMTHFTWITFKENVAVALTVAHLLGVSRADALRGMYAAAPDPGVLRVDACRHSGVRFQAVNLFAANDPQSTLMNLDLLRERGLVHGGVSVVINCRADRAERNGQMGGIVEQMGADRVFLIGSPTKSALKHIPPHLHGQVAALEGDEHTGEDLLDAIARYLPPNDPKHALVLVGNIHGRGEHLLEAIAAATHTVPDMDEELAAMLAETTVLPARPLNRSAVMTADPTLPLTAPRLWYRPGRSAIEEAKVWDPAETVVIPRLGPGDETVRMHLNGER